MLGGRNESRVGWLALCGTVYVRPSSGSSRAHTSAVCMMFFLRCTTRTGHVSLHQLLLAWLHIRCGACDAQD